MLRFLEKQIVLRFSRFRWVPRLRLKRSMWLIPTGLFYEINFQGGFLFFCYIQNTLFFVLYLFCHSFWFASRQKQRQNIFYWLLLLAIHIRSALRIGTGKILLKDFNQDGQLIFIYEETNGRSSLHSINLINYCIFKLFEEWDIYPFHLAFSDKVYSLKSDLWFYSKWAVGFVEKAFQCFVSVFGLLRAKNSAKTFSIDFFFWLYIYDPRCGSGRIKYCWKNSIRMISLFLWRRMTVWLYFRKI